MLKLYYKFNFATEPIERTKRISKRVGNLEFVLLPILPNYYEYKVSYDKREQFNFIKQLFNDSSIRTIVNGVIRTARGPIFLFIPLHDWSKNKEIKRLWINSLEVDEIRKGFNNLQDNKKTYYFITKQRHVK